MSNINSDTQQKIVNAIAASAYSLTLDAIVAVTGAPKNTVRGSLTKLRARGLVEKGPYGWRRPVTGTVPGVNI